jgi:hypothetical protein
MMSISIRIFTGVGTNIERPTPNIEHPMGGWEAMDVSEFSTNLEGFTVWRVQ